MGFIYPNKFTYLDTFKIELAHRCLDNGGITVLEYVDYMFAPRCPEHRSSICICQVVAVQGTAVVYKFH